MRRNGPQYNHLLSTNGLKMDYRKSVKRDRSEEAIRLDSYENDYLFLMDMESALSIPNMAPDMSKCSIDDSLIVYDVERGIQCEMLKRDERYSVCNSSDDGNRQVVADLKNWRFEVFENEMAVNAASTRAVIDLDANGRRWEGSVENGKPFGHGVIYDEEGRKEYEGFMINESKTCYGVEYYSDIGRVQYDGCFHNNKRFGKGTLYDRNGAVDYEGIWKNNAPYSSSFDGKTIDNHTESIDVSDDSYNKSKAFIIHSFINSLRCIVIGDNCYGSVRLFELDGLNELETVVIEWYSFTLAKTDKDIGINQRRNGACRMTNCPRLKSIRIGGFSFSDYRSLGLSNLSSLQSIDIGKYCFHGAPSFSLTGCILVFN